MYIFDILNPTLLISPLRSTFFVIFHCTIFIIYGLCSLKYYCMLNSVYQRERVSYVRQTNKISRHLQMKVNILKLTIFSNQ